MFNIVIQENHVSVPYNEAGQRNNMRWRIMYREGDTLVSQAGIMKCKDYFNDLVARRKGHVFSVYGFNNQDIKFNKWGVYLHLTGIDKPEQFCDNVDKGINVRLKQDQKTSIRTWIHDEHSVVVRIPTKLWESTYYISLVTMMLRVCNNNVDITCWDDFYEANSPLNTLETSFNGHAKSISKKLAFKAPLATWYYSGPSHNGDTIEATGVNGTMIHNNGVSTWCTYLTEAQRAAILAA
jgi:hypothetical protein